MHCCLALFSYYREAVDGAPPSYFLFFRHPHQPGNVSRELVVEFLDGIELAKGPYVMVNEELLVLLQLVGEGGAGILVFSLSRLSVAQPDPPMLLCLHRRSWFGTSVKGPFLRQGASVPQYSSSSLPTCFLI